MEISNFFRKRKRVETEINKPESTSGQSSDANIPIASSKTDTTASFELEAVRSNRISVPSNSISILITTNDCPNDIGNEASGPCQVILSNFPKNSNITHPKKTKSFQLSWYKRHRWIAYSISENKVYCFPCIFFNTHASGHQETTFTQIGFDRWDKVVGDKG